jgi:hypothetical protein
MKNMKIGLKFFLVWIFLPILLFIFIEYLTMKPAADPDGWTKIGFPFEFYKHTSGMRWPGVNATEFSLFWALLDACIIFAIYYPIIILIKKFGARR